MKFLEQANEVSVTSFTPLLNFASSIQIQITFLSFSYLIVLAKTFKIGNRGDESEHLCPVPDLTRKALSLWCWVWAFHECSLSH